MPTQTFIDVGGVTNPDSHPVGPESAPRQFYELDIGAVLATMTFSFGNPAIPEVTNRQIEFVTGAPALLTAVADRSAGHVMRLSSVCNMRLVDEREGVVHLATRPPRDSCPKNLRDRQGGLYVSLRMLEREEQTLIFVYTALTPIQFASTERGPYALVC